jgi:hypothetical protein
MESTDDDADLYVNFIVDNNLPQAIARKEIIRETGNDVDLQLLIKAIAASDRNMVKNTKNLRAFDTAFTHCLSAVMDWFYEAIRL